MPTDFVRTFSIDGKRYRARFKSRPFREGLEVEVKYQGKIIRVAELGLGEKAVIEKLKAIIIASRK